MAKKQATSKPTSNRERTQIEAKPANRSIPAIAPRRARVQEQSGPLSLPLILIFLSVSLLSLLWTVEAPLKPFAIFEPNPIAFKSPIFIRPRILLVTAHPDDEILFTPTILSILSEEKRKFAELWALCLSIGDYMEISNAKAQEELALSRRREWSDSWDTLGLEASRRWILDIPELKDNISEIWDSQSIADQVQSFVSQLGINTILTFDKDGITQHPNHISVPRGVSYMLSSDNFKAGLKDKDVPRLFTLKTQHTTSHYGPFSPIVTHLSLAIKSFFDQMRQDNSQKVPKTDSSTSKTMIYVSDFWGYIRAFKAALKHRSQWSLNSMGLLLWTNYLWVNEWIPVHIS